MDTIYFLPSENPSACGVTADGSHVLSYTFFVKQREESIFRSRIRMSQSKKGNVVVHKIRVHY